MKTSSWLQNLNAWRKKHRFGLQVAALLAGIAAPFALFAALSAGQVLLAALLFGLLAFSLLMTFWAG